MHGPHSIYNHKYITQQAMFYFYSFPFFFLFYFKIKIQITKYVDMQTDPKYLYTSNWGCIIVLDHVSHKDSCIFQFLFHSEITDIFHDIIK